MSKYFLFKDVSKSTRIYRFDFCFYSDAYTKNFFFHLIVNTILGVYSLLITFRGITVNNRFFNFSQYSLNS